MKSIKFLIMAFAALFLSATFTACGDDDDDKPKSEQTENKGDKNENSGNNSGNENQGNQGNENGGNGENSGNGDEGKDVEYSDDRDYSKDTKEAVDLGLSVKWATCNVGASSPEEYGSYFAWGETKQKKDYSSWKTYKYDGENGLTKYNRIDNKTVLEASDDAATVNWGGAWRMPTFEEQKELVNKCTWTWTTKNGVNGYEVSGENGNSIFLPAAGYRVDTELNGAGSFGRYWSSYFIADFPYEVYCVDFKSGYYDWDDYSRYKGHTVRPVCK